MPHIFGRAPFPKSISCRSRLLRPLRGGGWLTLTDPRGRKCHTACGCGNFSWNAFWCFWYWSAWPRGASGHVPPRGVRRVWQAPWGGPAQKGTPWGGWLFDTQRQPPTELLGEKVGHKTLAEQSQPRWIWLFFSGRLWTPTEYNPEAAWVPFPTPFRVPPQGGGGSGFDLRTWRRRRGFPPPGSGGVWTPGGTRDPQ